MSLTTASHMTDIGGKSIENIMFFKKKHKKKHSPGKSKKDG